MTGLPQRCSVQERVSVAQEALKKLLTGAQSWKLRPLSTVIIIKRSFRDYGLRYARIRQTTTPTVTGTHTHTHTHAGRCITGTHGGDRGTERERRERGGFCAHRQTNALD